MQLPIYSVTQQKCVGVYTQRFAGGLTCNLCAVHFLVFENEMFQLPGLFIIIIDKKTHRVQGIF